MLSKFIRSCLYILIILLPIIFFSLSSSPITFDRQLFISIFVLGGIILAGLGNFSGEQNKKGKVSFNRGKLSNFIYLFLGVAILSFFFSKSRLQSFWGLSSEATTLLNLILYTSAFFLFANTFLDVFKALIAFLAGGALLSLAYFATLLPAKSLFIAKLYQIVGSSSSLGLLMGGGLIILVSLISAGKLPLRVSEVPSKKGGKKLVLFLKPIFTWLVLALFISVLVIIDSWLIWIGIALAMMIILLSQLSFQQDKNKVFNYRRLSWPVIIFCLSIILIFVRLPFNSSRLLVPQIGPNVKLSSNIVSKTLKESSKNTLLGSGPATFIYQYDLHKPASINLGPFWQTRFSQASSSFLTLVSNLGVLGVISFLLIILVFIWQGFKFIFNKDSGKERYLRITIFASVLYFFFAFFLFPFNLLIWFYLFILLALWEVLNGKENPLQVKTVSFSTSSPKVISVTILSLAILISVSAILLYEVSQQYANQIFFSHSVSLYSHNSAKLNQAIAELQKSVRHNPKDFYLSNLSQLYLLRLNQIPSDKNLSKKGQQAELQADLQKSQQISRLACQINPVNSLNWNQLGGIYESIINFQGAGNLALSSYQQALKLSPTNPNITLALGRVNLALARETKGKLDSAQKAKTKDPKVIAQLKKTYTDYLKSAQSNFKKTIQLKGNFVFGYYWLGKLYEFEGKKNLALQSYKVALYLQPKNKQIKAKVDELGGK